MRKFAKKGTCGKVILFFFFLKKGDVGALNGLAFMHLHGIGTEKNVKKAIDAFQKASDEGHTDGLKKRILFIDSFFS